MFLGNSNRYQRFERGLNEWFELSVSLFRVKIASKATEKLNVTCKMRGQHPASSLHLELSIFDAFIFCFDLLLLPGQFTGQIKNNATLPRTSVEKDDIFQLKWMHERLTAGGILKSCLDPGSPTESGRWCSNFPTTDFPKYGQPSQWVACHPHEACAEQRVWRVHKYKMHTVGHMISI